MIEFNFDASKVNDEITAGSGGFQILEPGRYTFIISDISQARQTAQGDYYRLVTFTEERTRITFNEFLTIGVADDSKAWRIENYTAPLVYRLCQCTKQNAVDWYDALVGCRVSVEITKETQTRKTKNVDDFGNAETRTVEVNRIAKGRFVEVIKPVEGGDKSAALNDLEAFLSDN